MNKETTVRNTIASINVVEPTPQLAIRLAKADADSPTIVVNGMTPPQAVALDWLQIIDLGMQLFKEVHPRGGGGGGSGDGSGRKCTTIEITNPDGSSAKVTTCTAPQ
jgi:hypothetical protein